MAKYAFVDNDIITQVMVANSEADLGTLGQLFEVVNIDGLDPEPSRDWTRANGVWFPPTLPEAAKPLWNGAGFDDPDAPKEVEAPAEEEEEEKPAKKASK
jgi:hypothetical protein